VHLVRNLCDDVFGVENYIVTLIVKKKGVTTPTDPVNDFILWVSKDKSKLKLNKLYEPRKIPGRVSKFTTIIMPDGQRKSISSLSEKQIDELCENGGRFARIDWPVISQDPSLRSVDFIWQNKNYKCADNRHWTFSPDVQMIRLAEANRLNLDTNRVSGIVFWDDWAFEARSNIWDDTGAQQDLIYIVQTATKVISRCLLMTTDPGDLVLDITCGSGTTAYVAEQWGRRWITCDTSRIAITLAKKRLMTATFDYYKIDNDTTNNLNKNEKDMKQQVREVRGKTLLNCPSNGFIYKTVPHITLKSIANNEPAEKETLYDQPEIEKRKVRITGPFTVEALPAPVVKPLDDIMYPAPYFHENAAQKLFDWMQELKASGILGRKGEKIKFSRMEPIENKKFLHADAETEEDKGERKRAVINFAGETQPLDTRMVSQAIYEAQNLVPLPSYLIFAAFQFDPAAAGVIDETDWKGVTLLKVQMNPDLMTADLKKKISTNQSFWLIGQPDVELVCIEKGKEKGLYKVKVKGFDYFDINKGIVNSGNADQISMWMLDTDYDGMCVEPKQVFFPMQGSKDGWSRLAKTLKAEIDQDLIEKYRGTESLPFEVKANTLIAVKIVDDRGTESLKVIKVGSRESGVGSREEAVSNLER
jgi:adenine-specific DNA-methyltransferase